MANKYDEIKPLAQLDIFNGLSLDEVFVKYRPHGVARGTVQKWRDEIKHRLKEPVEVRAQVFADELEKAFVSLTKANVAMLELVQDRQWLMAKTAAAGGSQEVLTFIERLTINLIGLGRATGAVDGPHPAALPANTSGARTVECEIVDE